MKHSATCLAVNHKSLNSLFVSLLICIFVFLSFYLFVCLSICLIVCLYVCLFLCLSICLYVLPSMKLFLLLAAGISSSFVSILQSIKMKMKKVLFSHRKLSPFTLKNVDVTMKNWSRSKYGTDYYFFEFKTNFTKNIDEAFLLSIVLFRSSNQSTKF